MYDDWMKDMPIITSVYNKKIEKVYEGTIEPKKEEIECPHIIEEIDILELETFDFIQDRANRNLGNKINEIIKVLNIMNRGGR